MRIPIFLDPAQNGTPAGGASPQTPPAFSTPPGQRLVSEQDWNARENYYKAGQENGFTDPALFGRLKPMVGVASKRADLDIGSLASVLSGETPGNKQQAAADAARAGMSEEQINELLDRRMSERESFNSAYSEYESSMKGVPEKVKAKVLELTGGKEDEILGPILADAIMYRLGIPNRSAARFAAGGYPKGHPLHGQPFVPPPGDEHFDGVFNPKGPDGKPIKSLADQIKALRGRQLAAIGDAANQHRGASTAAGDKTGDGKPSEDKGERRDATPDEKHERARRALAKHGLSVAGA